MGKRVVRPSCQDVAQTYHSKISLEREQTRACDKMLHVSFAQPSVLCTGDSDMMQHPAIITAPLTLSQAHHGIGRLFGKIINTKDLYRPSRSNPARCIQSLGQRLPHDGRSHERTPRDRHVSSLWSTECAQPPLSSERVGLS